MDKYAIDSHKLIYHPERTAKWLSGEPVFPLYMEISPSGQCNHRCRFCGMDHMGYLKRFLDTGTMLDRITELGKLGLKSLMFAGEGEPLLHKDINVMASHAVSSGIDISFTTNGVLLSSEAIKNLLPVTSWIKISWNAGSAETYAKIHRCKESDFYLVEQNAKAAVQFRAEHKSSCTLGAQMILLPENKHEAVPLAQKCKQIGLDYLVIKPYSQNPQSKTQVYKELSYQDIDGLSKELSELNDDTFQVIFRVHSMDKQTTGDRPYNRCLALPFWCYLDSGGNLWSCLDHAGDNNFLLGNIYEKSFEEIWFDPQRLSKLKEFEGDWDCTVCRNTCRMDEINRYLHRLRKPQQHDGFI